MNNREYLQLEGASLVEEALLAFTSPAKGSDLYPLLCGSDGLLSEREKLPDSFFWDYVLLRLYLAEREIRTFKSGFGCLEALVEGDGREPVPFPGCSPRPFCPPGAEWFLPARRKPGPLSGPGLRGPAFPFLPDPPRRWRSPISPPGHRQSPEYPSV